MTSYDEDMGYRTMTREEATIIQQGGGANGQGGGANIVSPQTPTQHTPPVPMQAVNTNGGHHRASR